ncbi:hypothetical protein L6Q79_01745 [bacterium]|nr:hypothetical protein [bacterium]NUN44966.1 hypothetical protein [bacterium]
MSTLRRIVIMACLCLYWTACSEEKNQSNDDQQVPHFEWDPGSAATRPVEIAPYSDGNIAILCDHYDLNRSSLTGFAPDGTIRFQKQLPAYYGVANELDYNNGVFTFVLNPTRVGSNPLFMQVDTTGNVINQKQFVQTAYTSMYKLNSGGYMIRAATADSFKNKIGKLDDDGDILWEKEISRNYTTLYVVDDRVFVSYFNTDNTSYFMSSFDEFGNVLWTTELSTLAQPLICKIANQDYRITGLLYNQYKYRFDRLTISVMDQDGVITPLDTIPLNGTSDFYALESLVAGELVLVGRWSGTSKLLFMRIMNDGSWIDSYIVPDLNDFTHYRVRPTGNGAYLIMGTTYQSSTGLPTVMVYKVDAYGNYLAFD